MMLLGLHVVSIGALVAIVWSIAYQIGRKDGVKSAQTHYDRLLEDQGMDLSQLEKQSHS